MDWAEYVGHRVLVTEVDTDNDMTYEYTVMEVSPSGLRVKFKNSIGRMFWTDKNQYAPVEILS
jgi:hypothetical protein